MAAKGSHTRAASLPLIGKALIVLAAVATLVGGWTGYVYRQAMNEPLPGAAGRPGRCVVWFIGSSSIAKWSTLERDMRPWTVHNRGIGGAALSQIVRRFGNDDDVRPPAAIVFYGGENDIAAAIPVPQAFETFRTFLTVKDRRMGAAPVLFVSLKPTPARWAMRGLQADYNARVRRLATERSDLIYVDIVPDMLVGGRPGPFYDADGIHMQPIGYASWTRRIQAALAGSLPDVTARCVGGRVAGPSQ